MFRNLKGFLLAFACAWALTASDAAEARSPRHSAMILDANSGQILHNEDGDELRHPASLTKMMTLYLAFETLEAGRMSMSDRITVSQEAASVAPSKLELEPGEDISVSDAIRAIVTKSANDIAVAMAEKVGGSQANFVRLMNAKARDLGMTKTHFENASGLPNDAQVTTARDMITLALHLQDDFPRYYPLFATREFRYNGATHRNHNTMLNSFQGIDGIKTGYTQASGFNLVTSLHRGDKHLVGAVFGGASAASRNGEMRMLLIRALARASSDKTRKPALIAKLKSSPRLAERPAAKAKAAPAAEPAPVKTAQTAPVLVPRLEAPKVAAAPAQVAQPREAALAAAKQATVAPPRIVPKPAAAASLAQVSVVAPARAPAAASPAADAPAPVQAAAAAAAVETPATQAAPAVTAALAPQPAPAPVEVFKVKRVMVAPRNAAPAAATPDQTTDMPVAGDDMVESRAAAPRAALGAMASASGQSGPQRIEDLVAAGPGGQETVVAKKPPVRLASALDDVAMLGAADTVAKAAAAPAPPTTADAAQVAAQRPADAVPAIIAAPAAAATAKPAAAAPAAPAAVTAKPALVAKAAAVPAKPAAPAPRLVQASMAPAQRGLPPSTLSAQAAALARPAQAAPAAARVAMTAPAQGAAQGRFDIQIGAYASVEEAQRNLANVQAKASSKLAAYPSVTYPVQKGGRQVFRARFRGFDAQTAANTCSELRRQSIDCFVMTSE